MNQQPENTDSCWKTVIKDAQRGNIYDLNGRLVKSNAADTEGLQPGIYLMNGKKVMVR